MRSVTKETFNEIPGASYYVDKIKSDDPADRGHDGAERVFKNLQPIDGVYKIDVYSMSGGSYTVETRSYDAKGRYNYRVSTNGVLTQGGHGQTTYTQPSSNKARGGHQ